MKTFFTIIITLSVLSWIKGQDCNVDFEDFSAYECLDCDIETITSGTWIPYDQDSPLPDIFESGYGNNTINIPSDYYQGDGVFEPELIHVLDVTNPGVIDYSFDFYNECGVLVVDFLTESPMSSSDNLLAQIEFNYDFLVVGQDTIDACFEMYNAPNGIFIQLDFDSQMVILNCTEGPFYTSNFLLDASQLYGVAYGSNQCNFVSNVCVNNTSTLVDNDADTYFSDVDCDDSNPLINPGMTEIPYNGIDDDCNVATLEDDLDQDGFLIAEDCDDGNQAINPDAEDITNNGIDEDCDGVDFTSATHEIANAVLKIFPNPTSDNIYINLIGQLEYQVTLYDLQGRVLFQETNASLIHVENLVNGTYILELEDLASAKKVLERFVVTK